MMKKKDAAVATSLIIQGYLRANEDEGCLPDVLASIQQEVSDWADNLGVDVDQTLNAVTARRLSVDLRADVVRPVPRSPQNLATAVMALAQEMVDLSGPGALVDLKHRIAALHEEAGR
ncbi:MAG: hypothetical protein KGL39_40490 [Patescibacteria group bacterium]|nr:hypothetical protein [Patescibacteria group bacterium]